MLEALSNSELFLFAPIRFFILLSQLIQVKTKQFFETPLAEETGSIFLNALSVTATG